MTDEIERFIRQHMQCILDNDMQRYRETTSPDLTLYEWWVTPHRIQGLPFHEFMMTANARQGSVLGTQLSHQAAVRFDLANLHIQRYGDTAIASYTLLISADNDQGVAVRAHNESRVMVRSGGNWQVVHVHKSPAYAAPHSASDA